MRIIKLAIGPSQSMVDIGVMANAPGSRSFQQHSDYHIVLPINDRYQPRTAAKIVFPEAIIVDFRGETRTSM